MELEERVASAIRAQTQLMETFAPDVTSIRSAARKQTRRRAAMALGGVTVLTALALTAGLVGAGHDRSVPPVDRSEREDSAGVVTVPDVRATQVVVEPTLRSSITPGERLVASASTQDADYDGSGQVTLPLDLRERTRWEASCTGDPRLWFVALVEPGARYISSDRCEGAHEVGHHDKLDQGSATATLRMFVTEQDPREFRRCFNYGPPEGCEDVEPHPAGGSNARMMAAVYAEERGPVAVSMFGQEIHARASAFGSSYSLISVAAAATGARELSFEVAPSARPRIAQATQVPTERWVECLEKARPLEREGCLPTVQLLVDGIPVEDQLEGPFAGSAGWGPLPSGSEHVITFRVTQGDPRNVDLGVLVYEEDPRNEQQPGP